MLIYFKFTKSNIFKLILKIQKLNIELVNGRKLYNKKYVNQYIPMKKNE